MDRIINVKVGGNHLSKDNKNAGVKGEGNVTKLRITFDEGWDGYAKTVTFFDALGGNPVKRIETVDLIEDITGDVRTYITPIPQEPLAIAGEMTFVIDGYLDGKRQRSIADKLVVKDAPIADNATEPTDPTPTEPEQWQAQIEKIKDDIQQVANAREETAQFAEDAKGSADYAGFLADNAHNSEIRAYNYANEAKASAEDAKSSADKAETAIMRYPVIVGGNWHVWDAETNSFVDTGICAEGHTPVRGMDYWTEDDKSEVVNEVKDMKKSDWNQNDETAEDYVKNRTHYETTVVKTLGIGLYGDVITEMPIPPSTEITYIGEVGGTADFLLKDGDIVRDARTGEEIVVVAGMDDQITIGDYTFSVTDNGDGTYDYYYGTMGGFSEDNASLVTYEYDAPEIKALDEKFMPKSYADKEDKSNKINSWDELGDDSGRVVKYPTIRMMMETVAGAESNAVTNSNAYTDAKVGQLAERVTTNEESITGAFGAIQSNESRILTLEGDMGEVETALDNIIAIQNTLIGGGSV